MTIAMNNAGQVVEVSNVVGNEHTPEWSPGSVINLVTLASIIQGEANDQGLIGMQAVAAVIANRAAAGGW